MTSANWRAQLELIANIVVIATCFAVCAAVGTQYWQQRKAAEAALNTPVMAAGSVVDVSGEGAVGGTEFTVLVGLSPTCRYCDESMPVFRALNDRVRLRENGRVRVVAVGIQPREVLADYLARNALSEYQPIRVGQGSDLLPLVRRTPSVVLTTAQGRVLASWPGLMTNDRLADLLEYLEQKSARK